YEGEQLGQGRENAKQFLAENPEIMMEVSDKIRTQLGVGDATEPEAGEKMTAADELPIMLDD
ncbi:MAG TPA: DNA recombination/repair protein RecA, partial [Acidimicrobiales bacterium]